MKKIRDVVMVQSERHDVGYVLRICAIAALGGILFGYDTSVISGAITPLTEYFKLSPAQTGWAVSNVVVGCMIGALLSGVMADRVGRRMTLFICALLFSIQSVGTAITDDFTWFVIYRMIGGIAVGVASAVSPMYMSEVSPKDMRGRALSMEQFAIVFGQVVVFIVNYLIARSATSEWLVDMGWRWMFGSEIVPCILFCAVIFCIPESPRWHVLKGRHDEALKTLTRISNEGHARNLLREIQQSLNDAAKTSLGFARVLRDPRARWIIFVGAMIGGMQQITGINVMMYYAPMLLKSTSGSYQAALFQTIWIGLALLAGCVINAWIVDKHGRKPLIFWGSIGMVIGLLIVSVALYTQTTGLLALTGMIVFMLTFGFSWGPIAWILISEIFPNRFRAVGISLTVCFQWAANFLVSQFFPMLNENRYLMDHFHGAFSMWLFAGCGILGAWFVMGLVPETKGVSLEKIEDTMINHRTGSARGRTAAPHDEKIV
ncbi:sugar porter family MFS transporter [Swaminathania salitolerans]|uniref:D-xylose transporter XylE n=1 Tax=Swaminathania salitolerans TaxID=182838 RepID=A0A511BQ57_9PROT|nr:sugar porter family MFS transporter [Swaminathania salitolerans]GBQ11429.1 sugar transporter [Swaminathania salitolerans LMG 21291]GEL02477.1 D-xylose transporter XylE [Swaminathania salitolerans]